MSMRMRPFSDKLRRARRRRTGLAAGLGAPFRSVAECVEYYDGSERRVQVDNGGGSDTDLDSESARAITSIS